MRNIVYFVFEPIKFDESFEQRREGYYYSKMMASNIESIAMTAMGYGGWTGLGLAPILMARAPHFSQKCMIFLLAPPVVAMLMTGIVSVSYLFGMFGHVVFSVMIDPKFINTACASIALCVTTVSGTFTLMEHWQNAKDVKQVEGSFEEGSEEQEQEESGSEDEESGSDEQEQEESGSDEEEQEESGSDEEEQEEQEESGSEQGDGNSTVSNASSVTISEEQKSDVVDNTWRNEANFDGLRNAPPLPDSD